MRGSSEPVRIDMVETCKHARSSVQYDYRQIQEFLKHAECFECKSDEKCLWLCVTKNCKVITCRDNHSFSHFKEERHAVFLNLFTHHLWCFICKCDTVFPTPLEYLEEDEDEEEEDFSDSGIPKGLQNIGNTCYMNAALQALCNIPPIRGHFTHNYLPTLSDDKKHFLSRNFQRLIEDMCEPNGPRYLTPSGILHGIRTVHPIFRGCHQHDTQEFLRCFMDQLHDELKEHVQEVPYTISSKRSIHMLGGMEDERDEEEDGSGDHGEGGASSGSQSEAEYETCDSGVSERSSLSDEGERASIKRKHSLSCSPPTRFKLPQRPMSFHGPLSPSKQKRRPIKYRSIISELFDGKLLSSVECLTCRKVSTRIETFQDLSLPIPSRDHVNMLHQGSFSPQSFATCSDMYKGKPTWVSWLWEWVKSWFWGPTVSLHDCLSAFFSADELKGDNMYSCEQCRKLRNGMKFSKVLDLPEILCIHLKRFRHELSFSCKIANFVSFPLTDLDMRPYLHKDNRSKVTSFNLSSVICHHGTAGGGHYTCYAINPNSGQWYELDDKCVTPVSEATVANAEGYVLFYRKNNERAQSIWEEAVEMMCSRSVEQTLIQFHVSQRWLNRLKNFAEPGPIDNSDFLCPHGAVHPTKIDIVDRLTVVVSTEVWEYLYHEYGGGPVCNSLYQCEICETERIVLLNRANYEKNQFMSCETSETSIVYALSVPWFLQWEAFVKNLGDPPGPIDNGPIANKIGQNVINCDCVNLSQEKWQFLWNIYGGGPEIPIKALTKGVSRSSFSSGISVERERDRISASSSKAKSVESLPANLGAGDVLPSREHRSIRTQSVSSDNVNIRSDAAIAKATATANHRKQQSLDNVRLECTISVEKDCSKENQRNNEPSESDENAYCPAYTPDELNYVPFKKTTKNSTETAL